MFFRHEPQTRLRARKKAFAPHTACPHSDLRLQNVVSRAARIGTRGQKSFHPFTLVRFHLVVHKHTAEKARQNNKRCHDKINGMHQIAQLPKKPPHQVNSQYNKKRKAANIPPVVPQLVKNTEKPILRQGRIQI